MKITSSTMKEFRLEFAEAVKELEAKHDVKIRMGNISMQPNVEFTTKLTVSNNTVNGVDAKEVKFTLEAFMFGFKETDYKRKIKLQGQIYELVGFNRKSPKNDCTIVTLDGKKQFVMSSTTVKRCFI